MLMNDMMTFFKIFDIQFKYRAILKFMNITCVDPLMLKNSLKMPISVNDFLKFVTKIYDYYEGSTKM